jgi:DNA-binding MarR family transcriptional regulator
MAELTRSDREENFISLSAADARELARIIGLLLRDNPTTDAPAILRMLGAAPAASPPPDIDRERLVDRARVIFAERKRRGEFFPRRLFNEPAWDMLLALYVTDSSGGRQTIGKLVSWIGAPQTTALRWIDYLESRQMLSRQQHVRDRRITFVDLTDKGKQMLENYLRTVPDSVWSL